MVEKTENKTDTKTVQAPKLKIDLDKIVNKVRAEFGKDKSTAAKISTGANISRPTKDTDFILWKDSPFSKLTGVNGIPFGKIVQIAGRSNSGKSTHAIQFMKQASMQGVAIILIDSENKFAQERYEKLFGGDASQLLITTSKFILEAGDHVEKFIHAIYEQNPKQKVLIVWDSIGGSLPKNEGEGSLDASKQMAAASKENGAVLRGIVRLMEQYKDKENNQEQIACLLINQSYSNIGSPGQKEAGGAKVEYHSSIIIQLTRKADLSRTVKGVKMKYGIKTRAKVSKNHLFSGEMSISELDLIISAGGIALADEKKEEEVEEEEVDEG